MRRVLVCLLVVGLLVVAGCGSSKSSSSGSSSGGTTSSKTHLAKTKFVLHAGLAFGVFHRWIYKPFKRGDFNHPLQHKVAFTKALLATAVVIHEVRLARADAKSSKFLSKVVLPLTEIAAATSVIRTALSHHHADASAINSANSKIGTVHSESAAAGQPITETTAGSHIG